jgi:predicted RNA-binding protein YlqC (UPF0109 family)
MSEIDQQFIEYVVKSLVGKPDAVHIDRRVDEKGVLLELTVDPEDLGRVIGKRGATAQSLRTLLRALGTKNDARYNLKIVDNGDGGHKPDDKPAPSNEPTEHKTKDTDTSEPETAEPIEEESAAPVEEKPAEPSNDGTSDRLAQTRQELADLDDLDL